jgi:hypothetical protein
MVCRKKYFNIAAAGMCGGGSVATAVLAMPTGVGIIGIVTACGSLAWLISGLYDLAECLQTAGREAEAARVMDRVRSLEREVERLRQLIP